MQFLKDDLPSTLLSFPVRYVMGKRIKNLRAKLLPEGVLITLPCAYVPQSHLFAFLNKVKNWLLGKTHHIVPLICFQEGEKISIFGEIHEVRHIKGISNRIVLQDQQFLIVRVTNSVIIPTLLQKSLKTLLYEKVYQISQAYAERLGVKISKINVKKMTSRWGSCSSSGNLSYALNLVFAPLSMVEYVCAHEVAHLVHMNHSAQFWNCVAGIYPDYKKARVWLRENRCVVFSYNLNG